MIKKFITRMLYASVFAGCLAVTQAATVVWVSDNGPDGFSDPTPGFQDDGYITLLQNAGYTVKRYNGPNAQGTVLTQAHIDELNSYDLVILSRAAASAAWQTPQVTNWNSSITKPLLNCNAYLVRASRLGWCTGSTIPDGTPTPVTAVDLANPKTAFIFSSVAMNGNTTVDPYDEARDYNTSQVVEGPVAGGVILATATFTDRGGTARSNIPIIMEWPAGTMVRGGVDQLGGYRIYFSTGSREAVSGQPFGYEILTATGEAMFLKAVALAVNNGVVPVAGPIAILAQPTNTNVEAYSAIRLSCTVTGTTSYVQWFKDSTPIQGANSVLLNKANAQPGDAGDYYMIASNSFNAVTSDVAKVTVFVNPLVITNQPAAVINVMQARNFTLKVGVSGTKPFYQWYKDDVALEGLTKASVTISNATLEMTGNYYAIVTNLDYAVTTRVSKVTVSTDNVQPTVQHVFVLPSMNQVVVEFSEPMDSILGIMTDPFNYSGKIAPEVAIKDGVILTNNNMTVIIPTDPLLPDTEYTFTFDADMYPDAFGNFLVPAAVKFQTYVPNQAGGVVFEMFYATDTATTIAALSNYVNYPNKPEMAFGIPGFNTAFAFGSISQDDAMRNYYGGRLRGWFIPPFTGKWRLFFYTDDNGQLWFNTNGPAASGKMLVGTEFNYSSAFVEPPSTKVTEPFDLIAGNAYYLEVVFKEGSGGDLAGVGARLEGDLTPAASLLPLSSNYVGTPYIPKGLAGTVALTTQPASVTVEHSKGFTLSVEATSSTEAPILYQWQKSDDGGANWADFNTSTAFNVNQGTRKTLTLSSTDRASDDGDQYRCLVKCADVAVTSSVAVLTVTADMTGPMIVNALGNAGRTNITISFDSVLEPGKAGDIANYSVCRLLQGDGCVAILSATVTNDGKQVILETSPMAPGEAYKLTVNNITDTNNNTVSQPNFSTVGITLMFQQGVDGYTNAVDTHIRSDNATIAYGTNLAVLADNLSPLSHGLLRFGNIFGDGAGQIPVSTKIGSAILRLRTDNWGNDIRLHRMLVSWADTDTWNSLGSPNDGVSTNANGDAVTVPEIIYTTASGSSTAAGETRDVNVLPSVQLWANNGAPNLGWAFIDTGDDGYQFNSCEAVDVNVRPALIITYWPSSSLKLNSGMDAQGNIVISYPDIQGFKLYQADNVQGPYSPVTGGSGGKLVVPKPFPAKKFYKVQNP